MSVSPTPASPQDRFPRAWVPARVLYAVLTGCLMVLSFPLFGDRYHLDHLIWVTFVPLFLAAQGVGARRGFFLGWIAGMTLESAGFVWVLYAIRSFTESGVVISTLLFTGFLLYHAVPWGLLGLALGRCRRAAHVLWVLPLWVGIEHYYPRFWPWHVGGALYARTWLLQCVDLVGASGLTALVFLVNATVFSVLVHRPRGAPFPRWSVLASAVLVAAALVYGPLRLAQLERFEEGRPELTIGFVHGSLHPTAERNVDGTELYAGWTRELLREHPEVDLVVWPESADSHPFDLTPGYDLWGPHREPRRDGSRGKVHVRDDFDVPLLIGAAAVVHAPDLEGGEPVWVERYVVAAYVRRDDAVELYRKNRPVPFGEMVPFLDQLPAAARQWVRDTFPSVGNLDLGTDNPAMDLGGHTFRNLICYEAVIPDCVRRAAVGSDFLVNITEDYWYGRTAHTLQHLSVFILRAVESRVPVARCTNVGPSGVVDVTGRWRSRGEVFGQNRFVLPLRPGRAGSLYRDGGHWFPLGALLAGVAAQFSFSRRRPCAASGGTRAPRRG